MLSEIVEGWRNDSFPPDKLKDIIKQVSEERMAICVKCIAYDETGKGCSVPLTAPCCNRRVILPLEQGGIRGCGCPLNKKTKCLSCRCPANKWGPVLTEDEETKFDNNGEQ